MNIGQGQPQILDRLPWIKYGVAVFLTCAMLLVRVLIGNRIDVPNLIIFIIPIILSAYWGGLKPGLLATLLSIAGAAFFILNPTQSFYVASTTHRIQLVFLSLIGGLISVICEKFLREQVRVRTLLNERQHDQTGLAHMAAIVQSSDDAIISKTLDGIVTSWNAAAEELFGYSAEEMLGRGIILLIPPDRLDEEADILSHIRRGEGMRHLDTTRRRKDGTLIDVAITTSAIKDAAGNIIGASKIARDITERKRAEAALRDSEQRTRLATEATAVGIWEWNLETNQVRWDTQMFRMYGIQPTQDGIVGYDVWRDAVLPEELALQEVALQETIQSLGRSTRLFRIKRHDDQAIRYIEAVETVRINATEKAEWLVGTNLDVTERKQMEQVMRDSETRLQQLNTELEQRVARRTSQLELANKELEAFSYSVSHDLRAPLRAIDGYSLALTDDFGSHLPSEAQRLLQVIRNSAQQMGNLIDDLLTFARLSRLPLSKQKVNMTSLVRDALLLLQGECVDRRITINVDDLPPCYGDASVLKQVWVNLLSNAIKYTGKREYAIIDVSVMNQPGEMVYFVRDNGTGFDMRYADKLFGVFQRLHRAEDYEGTGVGLAIIQRIIHRHGGRIWVDSTEGVGTTFYFTLQEETNA